VGLVGRAGVVVVVAAVLAVVGACGEDACPPDASSCPGGCGPVPGYGYDVSRRCILAQHVVACLEAPYVSILASDRLVRVRDGSLIDVGRSVTPALVRTGAWRYSKDPEAPAPPQSGGAPTCPR
jgi:hypothetical protein